MSDTSSAKILFRGVNMCITDAGICDVPAQLQNINNPLAAGDSIIVSNISTGGIVLQRDLNIPDDDI